MYRQMYRGTIGLAIVMVAVALASQASLAITLTDRMHSRVAKGNQYYDKGEHDKALNEYRRAQEQDSANVVPQFNSGDALYKLGKFQEGAQQFLKAASSSTDSVSAMSYYNLGNTAFKSGDLQAAVEAYKRSLLIKPDDQDAKYNLEYALRMLKQEQQQQQNNQQDQKKSDRNDQQNEQQQNQQNQQDQQNQQQNQAQQEQQQQPRQSQMTPEELKRILAAVEASDRETQQELLQKAARTKRLNDEDW